MFGWEFPPHILGGLGTASYGLTKGMHENGDMDITFVIPKPYGDEEKGFAKIMRTSSWPYVEQPIFLHAMSMDSWRAREPHTHG